MMAQIRDVGDGIRGGTYTMTAPVITGGSINGTTVGAGTASTGAFTTLASNGATTFTAGTASTSTTTGTAVITGGLGVSGRINAANFDGIVGANTAAAGNFTTLGATGNTNLDGGTFVFNDSGADKDFRIEGDTDTNLFFTDASTDRIGVGTNTPASKLDVVGTASFSGTMGVGAFAAAPETGLNVRFIGNLTGADITGVSVSISAPETASNSTNGVYSSLRTTATSGSRGSLSCFYAEQPSIGAGSSVTSAHGVFVRNQGNAATSNAIGIRIEPQSGSAVNLGIYNESSARFDGNIGLNTAPAASGTGITFPATQSDSSDANTLDDYEEGTWTPVVTSQTGSLTAYTSSGRYTKIGNTVYVSALFAITTAGTAGSYANISGYPFTSRANQTFNGSTRESASTGNLYNATLNPNDTTGIIGGNANAALVWTNNYEYTWNLTYQV
jgi:hypothetical protein